MAQLPAFQYCTSEPLFIECTVNERQWLTFKSEPLELSLVLIHVVMCMIIMQFFPKIPKVGKWIPASLVGLLVGTLVEWTLFRMVIGQGTRTVRRGKFLSRDAMEEKHTYSYFVDVVALFISAISL